jgi:hypothetical protein
MCHGGLQVLTTKRKPRQRPRMGCMLWMGLQSPKCAYSLWCVYREEKDGNCVDGERQIYERYEC